MTALPTAVTLIQKSVLLDHEIGLHARPSVKLTKLAKRFAAEIEVKPEDAGDWTNAKSIVKVMALKVKKGAVLHFRAQGSDAPLAVDALVGLVERNFEDGGG